MRRIAMVLILFAMLAYSRFDDKFHPHCQIRQDNAVGCHVSGRVIIACARFEDRLLIVTDEGLWAFITADPIGRS